MYNKLFTKILDSSIWLESTPTRIVWVTFLAMMDQDGMVALSSVGNVANRARVTEEEAAEAIRCLESPDLRNPDQDNEGRRIERIPGLGWLVLNSEKYKNIVKLEMARAMNRERVQRHRAAHGNGRVMVRNESVMQSDTDTDTEEEKNKRGSGGVAARPPKLADPRKVHPAIVGIQTVTGKVPPKELWDELINSMGDQINMDHLLKCWVQWRARGFKATNFAWALEWYPHGIPEKNGSNHRPAQVGKAPDVIPEPLCHTCGDAGEVSRPKVNAQYEWEVEFVPCGKCGKYEHQKEKV